MSAINSGENSEMKIKLEAKVFTKPDSQRMAKVWGHNGVGQNQLCKHSLNLFIGISFFFVRCNEIH